MTAKILIADDHGIVRQGIRSLLERQLDIEVVAEAQRCSEALSLIDEFKPDVVIIDAAISNVNETGGAHQVLNIFPDVKVVVLAEHSCTEFVSRMFEAGVCGYILKGFLFQELVTAVNTVLQGGIYLSPAVKGVQVDIYAENREV